MSLALGDEKIFKKHFLSTGEDKISLLIIFNAKSQEETVQFKDFISPYLIKQNEFLDDTQFVPSIVFDSWILNYNENSICFPRLLNEEQDITPETKVIQMDPISSEDILEIMVEIIVHWNLNVMYSNEKKIKKEFKTINQGNSNNFVFDIIEELLLKEEFIFKIKEYFEKSLIYKVLKKEEKIEEKKTEDISKRISTWEEMLPPYELFVQESKYIEGTPMTLTIILPKKETEISDWHWIGFYLRDQPDRQYMKYFYINSYPKQQRNGRELSIEFQLPIIIGVYNFRLFDYRYNQIAISHDFHVGPIVKLSIRTDMDPLENKTKIEVEWEKVFGRDIKDASISLVLKDTNKVIETEKAENPVWMKNFGLKPIGRVTFAKPKQVGSYVAKFFISNFCISESSNLILEDKFKVSVKSLGITIKPLIVTRNTKPVIGIYNAGETRPYNYLYIANVDDDDNLEFRMKKDGKYDVRLFLDESLDSKFVYQQRVLLIRKDRLDIVIKGSKVIVGLYIENIYPDWSAAWVALYKIGSESYDFDQFISVTEKDKVVVFKAVSKGRYVVRFYQNQEGFENDVFVESDPFPIGNVKLRPQDSYKKKKKEEGSNSPRSMVIDFSSDVEIEQNKPIKEEVPIAIPKTIIPEKLLPEEPVKKLVIEDYKIKKKEYPITEKDEIISQSITSENTSNQINIGEDEEQMDEISDASSDLQNLLNQILEKEKQE
eukprot:gene2396-2860_t